MKRFDCRKAASLLLLPLFLLHVLPKASAAGDRHVVPLGELRQELRAASESRAANLESVERILALPEAREALASAGVNADRAIAAVATLGDEELQRLADRARTAEHDVEGGLIIGVLALIGLIVVIVFIVSVVN